MDFRNPDKSELKSSKSLTDLLGVQVGGDGRVVAAFDFAHQRVQVGLLGVEGGLECGHLVQHAAQAPDVGLEVVALLHHALRGPGLVC